MNKGPKSLEYFLRDLNIVKKKYEEREQLEDNFNLFTILKKYSDEKYLHSRFISSLLDPEGPHKMKVLFLNLFLNKVNSLLDFDDGTVEIYPNNQSRSEYKRIDISLIDRNKKQAIIIENKIFHTDTNNEEVGQLEKYYGCLIEEDKISADNIEVYYLTLDGHEPSEASVSTREKYPELKQKVRCISYALEILDWLKACIKESYNKPALRESINQYIKLIEQMTNNNAAIEERKEITRIIGLNDENLFSAKLLLDNYKHVQWHTLYDFWKELSQGFEHEEYKILLSIPNEDIDTLVHGGPKQRRKIDLTFVVLSPHGLPFDIFAEFGDWLSWGIYDGEDKASEIPTVYKDRITAFAKEHTEYEETKDWLWWKYFDLTDNDNICCSHFNYEGTFKLISPRYRHEVIEKIIKEIKDFETIVCCS